ncbi:MAG: hypothetical protein AVDCRST_MAG29-560 [uncultured Nocardioidaceae bacterium]|uniref:Uncharacterized protein n=1 Tax=uncultured Nocardioidaceae bacterium TaxID=253824 RepID=A0A6J4L3P1_9ACTN|nr:MAG: hypothetical protein AVDCRST_MAG29-560 [uncultured Nocardioidaceae bacterium]
MGVAVQIELEKVTPLRFDDGSPVRAASAVASFGSGWLIAQDDATHGAWWVDGAVTPVRLLPPVEGLDVFDSASGTKHLKPDLEAASEVRIDDEKTVLLLGSGSASERMRASLMRLDQGTPTSTVIDLTSLYARVAGLLGVELEELNMEGACVVGSSLRWFQRGLPQAGLPTASVDLDLSTLVAAVAHGADVSAVEVSHPRTYDLGEVHGVGLAVTDAVCLGGESLLVSSAAEDTPNPRDDGPVVGSALASIENGEVRDMAPLPYVDEEPPKVEGLSVLEHDGTTARVLATVDADDPGAPSLAVHLHVRW